MLLFSVKIRCTSYLFYILITLLCRPIASEILEKVTDVRRREAFKKWITQGTLLKCGPGSSVGIATDYGLDGPGSNPGGDEIFARPDRLWDPPSLLYDGYQVFPWGKVRPGRAADHSPPSSTAIMEEYSCNSTHPLGHTGPVTGSLYLYLYLYPT